jgi:hypothetical protein
VTRDFAILRRRRASRHAFMMTVIELVGWIEYTVESTCPSPSIVKHNGRTAVGDLLHQFH